jgi:lysophospholipase L1-like esterase
MNAPTSVVRLAGLIGSFLVGLATLLGAEIELQEKVRDLGAAPQGPFVRTGDGAILGVDERGGLISRDDGTTWMPRPLYDSSTYRSRPERALLRTKEGILLYAFLNENEKVFKWDDKQGGPLAGCRLPMCLSRSEDDGKTWAAPVLLQEGWCGAVRQMIQLRSGRIVLVSQVAKANPGRHVTVTYLSDDLGKTWRVGEVIDLGTEGNYAGKVAGLTAATHGGGIEGTIFEKQAGGAKLLLRVPHGYLHELTSSDGTQWKASMPSTIEASDSPAMVVRLASGRLALAWNRYRDPVAREGRRDELSIAFSENDGLTWTIPQVIARNRKVDGGRESRRWISYPYIFEPTPGRVWVSTMQGNVRVELNESDFITPVAAPLGGRSVRILALGDSITRGARPGVGPNVAFPAQLEAALRNKGVRASVHGVGIGSERTDLALARLERDVLSQRPDFVTVMYGTNDSRVDRGKQTSRLTADAFESNLNEMIARLRGAKIQVVLMTPPRFAEEFPRDGLGDESNARLAPFADRVRKLAAQMGVPLVDHFGGWTELQQRGQRLQEWTTDGCHPNSVGHSDLADRATAVIAPLAAAISLSSL